jgi:hypothetical protein
MDLRPILKRLLPIGGWVAAVGAGVASTVIATHLLQPPPAPDDPPFTIAVRTFPGVTFVFDGDVSEAPERPVWDGEADPWYEWARRAGAVPTAVMAEVTVQGRSEAEVTLTDLRVRVVERKPAPSGVLFGPALGALTPFAGPPWTSIWNRRP